MEIVGWVGTNHSINLNSNKKHGTDKAGQTHFEIASAIAAAWKW